MLVSGEPPHWLRVARGGVTERWGDLAGVCLGLGAREAAARARTLALHFLGVAVALGFEGGGAWGSGMAAGGGEVLGGELGRGWEGVAVVAVGRCVGGWGVVGRGWVLDWNSLDWGLYEEEGVGVMELGLGRWVV